MSLSDYIRYLRAVNGGLTPWEIAEGSDVPAREIHLLEVKHRRIGDNDDMLLKLSKYFKVPVEEFTRRREAYRKRLTAFLEETVQQPISVAFKLENGEEIEGKVTWFAREAVAVEAETGEQENNHPCIIQRSWIANWRLADSPTWEVDS